MSYSENSEWNGKNEIRCMIIFKKLESEGFPRGKQMEYCREMALLSKLDAGNISAKVSNYKSVAGINKPSHASVNTIDLYKRYCDFSIPQLKELIQI